MVKFTNVKNQISYQTDPIPFKLNKAQIDYFKIPISELKDSNLNVTHHNIELEADEMLNLGKHLGVH